MEINSILWKLLAVLPNNVETKTVEQKMSIYKNVNKKMSSSPEMKRRKICCIFFFAAKIALASDLNGFWKSRVEKNTWIDQEFFKNHSNHYQILFYGKK